MFMGLWVKVRDVGCKYGVRFRVCRMYGFVGCRARV